MNSFSRAAGMDLSLTPEETALVLELLKALACSRPEERGDVIEPLSQRAVRIANALGLREWYELFYEELQEDAIAAARAEPLVFHWKTVCQCLAAGQFGKAKTIILRHSVLSLKASEANERDCIQAEVLTDLIDLIETRPTVLQLRDAESPSPFESVEISMFSEAYQTWFHEKLASFQEALQKHRLQCGLGFSGNMQDIANIFSGNERCLRDSAEDKLAFFIGRIFHTPRFISTHLQLRVIWENIVGNSGPCFSTWNPSLRALMRDVMCIDQKQLLLDLSRLDTPLSLFTRMVLGLIFDAFFEDEGSVGREPLPDMGNETFFQICAARLASQMQNAQQIVELLLFCPSMHPIKAAEILSHLDMRQVALRTSFVEFAKTEAHQASLLSRIEAAGWLHPLQELFGRAHHLEGHVGLGALYFLRSGTSDLQNVALKSVQDTVTEILSNDRRNFLRALEVESLSTEELLSAGPERDRLWAEIKALLKEIPPVLEKNTKLLTKLQGVSSPGAGASPGSFYGLMVSLTELIRSLPTDTDAPLELDERQKLQKAFQSILHHSHLPQELQFLIGLRVVSLCYLFGSHLPGYRIFGKGFTQEVLAVVKNKSLSDIDATSSLQRIVHAMHKAATGS